MDRTINSGEGKTRVRLSDDEIKRRADNWQPGCGRRPTPDDLIKWYKQLPAHERQELMTKLDALRYSPPITVYDLIIKLLNYNLNDLVVISEDTEDGESIGRNFELEHEGTCGILSLNKTDFAQL